MSAPLAIWVDRENLGERRKVSDQFIQLVLRIGHGAPGGESVSNGEYVSGVPTLRLSPMNENCVGIGGSISVSPVDGDAMVGTVVHQVKDRLFTTQHTLLAIHEHKANGLMKLRRREAIEVLGQPLIGSRQPAVELIELGQGIGVGAVMGAGSPSSRARNNSSTRT